MNFHLTLPLLIASQLFPLSARSETCPAAPDNSAAFDTLFEEVAAAPDQQAAQLVTNRMWELWAEAPDEAAQEILDRGLRRRAARDFLGAKEDFETLIAYCPEYAEGYNQRGFIAFIQQDYEAALADLDRVIALSPRHVGALSGRALTLMQMGRDAQAYAGLQEALALNPWLPERRFLDRVAPSADSDL